MNTSSYKYELKAWTDADDFPVFICHFKTRERLDDDEIEIFARRMEFHIPFAVGELVYTNIEEIKK